VVCCEDEGVLAKQKGGEHAGHGGAMDQSGREPGRGCAIPFVTGDDAGERPDNRRDDEADKDASDDSQGSLRTRQGLGLFRGCRLRRRRRCS